MSRKPIFDAIKAARGGKPFLVDDVREIDALLTRLGIPGDGPAAPSRPEMKDKEAFYKGVRGVTGSLDQAQVSVIEALLSSAASHPTSWLAYELATAWHEARLKPIAEIGKGKGRKYGVPGARMKPVPNAPSYGGQIPYGRGLVQLTWVENYERADRELGLNGALLANFDKALEPDIAVKIMIEGMEEGWFTGKKLADYFPDERGTHAQAVQARRIINGTDRADLIAGYFLQFQAALTAGGRA